MPDDGGQSVSEPITRALCVSRISSAPRRVSQSHGLFAHFPSRLSSPDLMSFPKDEWCVLSDITALSRLLCVSVPLLSAASHLRAHARERERGVASDIGGYSCDTAELRQLKLLK